MTVKELKQYRSLKGEIQDIEDEIKELKSNMIVDVVKSSYSEFPFTEHSVSVQGCDKSDFNKIRILHKKKQEKQVQVDCIEQFIDNIQDSQLRRVFKLKYIKDYSWAEVARCIGGNNTRDSVRKMSRRFLEKN